MTPDRPQAKSSMTTRQKITAAAFAVIVLVILWQIYGLFGSSTPKTVTPATTPAHPTAPMNAGSPNGGAPMSPQSPMPAQLQTQSTAMSPEEGELYRAQQQLEVQYLSAVNQLQMLKIERDIAETNKAIMTARLETVTAQKNIVDLLQPPTPPATPATYARGLVYPTPTSEPQSVHAMPTPTLVPAAPEAPPVTPEINYSVISVSRLQNRWAAVLGYQGNLYRVSVGDILPPDSSMVIAINRSGVVLERKGVKRKISLVPII